MTHCRSPHSFAVSISDSLLQKILREKKSPDVPVEFGLRTEDSRREVLLTIGRSTGDRLLVAPKAKLAAETDHRNSINNPVDGSLACDSGAKRILVFRCDCKCTICACAIHIESLKYTQEYLSIKPF